MAVGFVRVLRRLGLKVPASSTINFTLALGAVGVTDRDAVYWAGRATLLHRPEDIPVYDHAFRTFWERGAVELLRVETPATPATLVLDADDEADAAPDPSDDDQSGDVDAVRFSRVEILTSKDFSACSDEELAELTRMMTRLRFTTFRRLSRRQVPTKRRGQRPDLGRTVRWALRHHGEPLRWAHTEPASRPRRLIMILDVSGSMESYARALIRFVHAAVIARGRVEVFTIGTRLTRLTRQLNNRDPDAALAAATPEVQDWAGGTRLGEAMARFNDEWGVRGLARGAVVVILSDGWDRGDAALLGEQMQRLHRVTHRLIWVNPLKASPGYAPLAAGMAAALPHVDDFVSGNTYESIEQLAAILSGDAR
ncbi:MAG: VWA domain-containing protein [Actinomycetota bacterium]|nr:VWA domain-containing protein [Actinomycetota bacterium]